MGSCQAIGKSSTWVRKHDFTVKMVGLRLAVIHSLKVIIVKSKYGTKKYALVTARTYKCADSSTEPDRRPTLGYEDTRID